MTRSTIASIFTAILVACGPEVDDEPEAPGVLEYEHPYARIYRLDRRVDVVLVHGDTEERECGMLSDRAYTELEDTLGALDPHEDYRYDPEAQGCSEGAGTLVHVQGFEHSPFSCSFFCCHRELARAGLIYTLIETWFNYQGAGGVLEIDGEPYIAIEPDEPCPE